jgi:hypothetical protein
MFVHRSKRNSDFRKPVCRAVITRGLSWALQAANRRASSSSIKNPIRALASRNNRTCFTGFSTALPQAIAWVNRFLRNANSRLIVTSLRPWRDILELRTVLVQSDSGGPTPYGGKSIGEQPIGAVGPAIVNAVLDAVGVSIADLPVTSEKARQALQARPTGA